MEKKEHMQYWIDSVFRDWEVVKDLVKAGKYMYALFFAHLTIEARYQDYIESFYKLCTSEYT